jgi:hypothetical protein
VRYRVCDYRLICGIQDDELVVLVLQQDFLLPAASPPPYAHHTPSGASNPEIRKRFKGASP